jgi:hypothetical protein
MQMEKFVTVLVAGFNDDGDCVGCESGSREITGNDDAMIEDATDEAIERYGDNIGTLPERHRIVVQIVKYPTPKRRKTVTTAVLPDMPDDADVIASTN